MCEGTTARRYTASENELLNILHGDLSLFSQIKMWADRFAFPVALKAAFCCGDLEEFVTIMRKPLTPIETGVLIWRGRPFKVCPFCETKLPAAGEGMRP